MSSYITLYECTILLQIHHTALHILTVLHHSTLEFYNTLVKMSDGVCVCMRVCECVPPLGQEFMSDGKQGSIFLTHLSEILCVRRGEEATQRQNEYTSKC